MGGEGQTFDLMPIIITVVVIVVVALIIGWAIKVYNNLVKARNQVENSWSQIDVQLTRRFDLIPNLVETVKGYATHEKEIWEGFAAARRMYDNAKAGADVGKLAEAEGKLSSTLGRLLIVQEQYPELKADTNFANMMSELKETEKQIAFTRQFYNDVVLKYNNLREMFPGSIIASIFKFKEAEYFKASEESRVAPKVSF